jgi:hypothetical protein
MTDLTATEVVGVELARLVSDMLDMIADGRAQFAILPVEGGDEQQASAAQAVLLAAIDDRARALVNVGDIAPGAASGLAVKNAVDSLAHEILQAHGSIPFQTLVSTVAIAVWRSARGYGGRQMKLGDLTWGFTVAVAEMIADLPSAMQPAATQDVMSSLPKAVAAALGDRIVIRNKTSGLILPGDRG